MRCSMLTSTDCGRSPRRSACTSDKPPPAPVLPPRPSCRTHLSLSDDEARTVGAAPVEAVWRWRGRPRAVWAVRPACVAPASSSSPASRVVCAASWPCTGDSVRLGFFSSASGVRMAPVSRRGTGTRDVWDAPLTCMDRYRPGDSALSAWVIGDPAGAPRTAELAESPRTITSFSDTALAPAADAALKLKARVARRGVGGSIAPPAPRAPTAAVAGGADTSPAPKAGAMATSIPVADRSVVCTAPLPSELPLSLRCSSTTRLMAGASARAVTLRPLSWLTSPVCRPTLR